MTLFTPPTLVSAAGISISDDGDAAPSSGISSEQHTYSNLASGGPDSYALVTYHDGNRRTLSSATWGGVPCAILVQEVHPTSGAGELGCAILHISGAQSGDLKLNWSNVVFQSHVTVVSLSGVIAPSMPIDTDSDREDSQGSAGVSLDSLASPGAGGIRLANLVASDDATVISWSNAAELSNVTGGTFYRHTTAYDSGSDGSTIDPVASGGTSKKVIVGVSLR